MEPESNLSDRLERRMAAIRDGRPLFVAVYCNACSRVEAARTATELAPKLEGWLIAEHVGGHDLCPACRPEEPGWAGSFPKHR